MVQVPVVTMVAVVPLTVQTLAVCELNDTVKPEVEVATSVSGVFTVCVPGLLKVIVCGLPFTVMVLPATEATVPDTPAWCLGSGHLTARWPGQVARGRLVPVAASR